jgi:hypothetical protein
VISIEPEALIPVLENNKAEKKNKQKHNQQHKNIFHSKIGKKTTAVVKTDNQRINTMRKLLQYLEFILNHPMTPISHNLQSKHLTISQNTLNKSITKKIHKYKLGAHDKRMI